VRDNGESVLSAPPLPLSHSVGRLIMKKKDMRLT